MFCRYCGKNIAEDSIFCTYCGKAVGGSGDISRQVGEREKGDKKAGISEAGWREYMPLIVKAVAYVALGAFLFFNIKMAPFYGWRKFLAYLIEAMIAIGIAVLIKNKLSECDGFYRQLLTIIFCSSVVVFSVGLRIVYEAKVDPAEKDIPNSGQILIDISERTEYYSTSKLGRMVRNPSTTVKINETEDPDKISLGKAMHVEIKVEGDGQSSSYRSTMTLKSSAFKEGRYSFTKTIPLYDDITTKVTVTIRRYCTFWDVVFY